MPPGATAEAPVLDDPSALVARIEALLREMREAQTTDAVSRIGAELSEAMAALDALPDAQRPEEQELPLPS